MHVHNSNIPVHLHDIKLSWHFSLHNLQTLERKIPVYSAKAVSAMALAFTPSLLHIYFSLQKSFTKKLVKLNQYIG